MSITSGALVQRTLFQQNRFVSLPLRLMFSQLKCSIRQGELEHRTPKNRYIRTSGKTFVMQMTRIERREARLRRIRAKLFEGKKHGNEAPVPQGPEAHHHIGKSQNSYEHIGTFLRNNLGDPAIKVCICAIRKSSNV